MACTHSSPLPPLPCPKLWLLPAAICCAHLLAADGQADPRQLQVSTDFPGGAARVIAVDQAAGTIKFQIPDDQNGGWRRWWYFKLTGVQPGQTIKLDGPEPDTPVFSLDGKTWRFVASKKTGQKVEAGEAHFAWYVPFLPADTEALAERAQKACAHAKRFELCKSEAGIPVVGLRIAEPAPGNGARFGVWIQARQHAWEAGGSWTAAGLVDWLVSDDARAGTLRKKADITIVPIMDVDSVVKGRGGKEQKPHDHNRDWSDKPHWKAVEAAQRELRTLNDAGRLHLFLDLHDPGYTGGFQFWHSDPSKQPVARQENTQRFVANLTTEFNALDGSWRFGGLHDPAYIRGKPASGNWVRSIAREHVIAGTIEIPVGPPRGVKAPLDPPAAHLKLGAALGAAIELYFRQPPKTADAPAGK